MQILISNTILSSIAAKCKHTLKIGNFKDQKCLFEIKPHF
jgi:hypothetical protein